jgi:hypothetical protein
MSERNQTTMCARCLLEAAFHRVSFGKVGKDGKPPAEVMAEAIAGAIAVLEDRGYLVQVVPGPTDLRYAVDWTGRPYPGPFDHSDGLFEPTPRGLPKQMTVEEAARLAAWKQPVASGLLRSAA